MDIPARTRPAISTGKLGKPFSTHATEYVSAYARQASFRPRRSARLPTNVPNTIEEPKPATKSLPTSASVNP